MDSVSRFSDRKNQPVKIVRTGARAEKIVTFATSIFE
jgi:hypothetical protein